MKSGEVTLLRKLRFFREEENAEEGVNVVRKSREVVRVRHVSLRFFNVTCPT